MIVFSFVSTILLIVGIVVLLELTPENMTKDVIKLLEYEESLTIQAKEARGMTSSNRISKELNAIRYSLEIMDKERQFAIVCTAALALFISGMIISVLIDNWFLAPILSVAFAVVPFVYVKSSMSHFEKMMNEELETAISIITTSYVRNDDIVSAVKENLSYIKPPVKNMMVSFVNHATVISADTKSAILELRNSTSNYIFQEWCDTLISCQDDRTQKTALLPIVAKFTDVRQVNSELQTLVFSPRSEYITMVILVLMNFPLMYALNKEWFDILVNTTIGKATVAIVALVVLITAVLMLKYTKPIEYKK